MFDISEDIIYIPFMIYLRFLSEFNILLNLIKPTEYVKPVV